ncbi:MAG TPA: HIT domain-containing protein [Candidatus Wallbacteria bacterium]|nr:HIT domain-containing protein [Candidatus Wallbacteria bacterium]
MIYKNLFSPDKLKYVTGKSRPKVGCILCAVTAGDAKVRSLEVHRSENFVVSLNLYPFNVAHLLIFPVKHVETLKGLGKHQIVEMYELANEAMEVIDELYSPGGYNVGFNIGACSGASIAHLHMHIVPRYDRELGFVDIVGGAKLIVEAPGITMKKIKNAFKKRKNKEHENAKTTR